KHYFWYVLLNSRNLKTTKTATICKKVYSLAKIQLPTPTGVNSMIDHLKIKSILSFIIFPNYLFTFVSSL
ncbi:hypothetical protein N9A85_06095, partial [Gammaproteobacteria bacterium]|nr:hypothetical protein [Gammaproteobacteria bacterium]